MTIRPYRYYLIDLDRTLWDFDSNSEHAIGLLISRNPVLYKAVQEKEGCGEDSLHRFFMRYDVLNHRLWAMYEKGEMTKEDLRWKRFHEAFRRYGIEDEALARQFGEDYLEQMVCENRLMPGAREMLEAIRSAGGKMAILSNGFREVQYRKVERLSGIRRQDNLEAWREAKRQTLMIGDDPVNDIEGAQIFGIDQFYYNHKGHKAISHATYESPDLTPFL